MRLQSYLSQSGVASRRGVVQALEDGKVKVNGEVVRIPSYPIFPKKDRVQYEDKDVKPPEKRLYFLFHKPKGVITTARDTHGRKTVLDFFKDVQGRPYPVGRLDKDTTGVLLVTNDGAITNRLTHPRFGVQKIYDASLNKVISQADVEKLEKGVVVEGEKTAPCRIKILSSADDKSKVEVSLHEGRKRQIRRMFETLQIDVLELHRRKFGPLTLQGLREGERRELIDSEIEALKEASFDREEGSGSGSGPRNRPSGRFRGGRGGRFRNRGRGGGRNRSGSGSGRQGDRGRGPRPQQHRR